MKRGKEEKKNDIKSKINTYFLQDSGHELPKKETMDKAERIIEKIGHEHVKSFVWSSNWSDTDAALPPTGFSLAVDENTPLCAAPFHPTKFCLGTSIVKIGSRQGKQLFENEKNREHVTRKVNDAIVEYSEKCPPHTVGSLETMNPSSPSNDQVAWKEMLSGNGAYIGVFYSNDNYDGSKYAPERDYYVACQSGYEPASEKIYSLIEENESEQSPLSWKKFFSENNNNWRYLSHVISRNRNRLIASFCQSLGIDAPIQSDLYAFDHKVKIVEPSLETITHFVDRYDVHSKQEPMVYYSNTVNPSTTKGSVINQNPYIGLSIMNGPNYVSSSSFGSTWKPVKESFNAFPYSTGKVPNALDNEHPPVLEEFRAPLFASIGIDMIPSTKVGLYRTRTPSFRRFEQKLGYDHSWGQINLRPYLVKLCCPSEFRE